MNGVYLYFVVGHYLDFKGNPSDRGTKILQTEKSSLYSQSLLVFIHKTPVVETHPTTREIRDLLRTGRHQQETDKASNIAFDEDIMENNYMFVMMLRNLSVISHWVFPQFFFYNFWREI